MKRPVAPLVLSLLTAAATWALLGGARLADRVLMCGSTAPLAVPGATRLEIPWRGGVLEAWVTRSPTVAAGAEPECCVLRFYGNADRAEAWAAQEPEGWAPHAVEVWGVNYPGFGGSTGPAHLDRLAPAALAAHDALRARAGDLPILVHGASLGTTAALVVAAQRPVQGVLIHAPAPLREGLLGKELSALQVLALPLAAQIPRELDSFANARRAKAPAVFLIPGGDAMVAARVQHAVAAQYAGPKQIVAIPGAAHNATLTGEGWARYREAREELFAGRGGLAARGR